MELLKQYMSVLLAIVTTLRLGCQPPLLIVGCQPTGLGHSVWPASIEEANFSRLSALIHRNFDFMKKVCFAEDEDKHLGMPHITLYCFFSGEVFVVQVCWVPMPLIMLM